MYNDISEFPSGCVRADRTMLVRLREIGSILLIEEACMISSIESLNPRTIYGIHSIESGSRVYLFLHDESPTFFFVNATRLFHQSATILTRGNDSDHRNYY